MAFLRRKSGVYHEDIYHGDPEPQHQHQRRRLSKPPTNSSATNLVSVQSQQLKNKKSFHKSGQDTPITYLSNESREAIRSHIFSSTSDLDLTKLKSRGIVSAYMATFSRDNSAQASTSQLSVVSPTLPSQTNPRRLSIKRASDSHKPSISSLGSRDRYALDHDLGTVSPESSVEQLVADPTPRARRTASFTPGMATRVPKTPTITIDEESSPILSTADAVVMRQTSVKDVPRVEIERSWSPPPQTERPVTPADLDITHIGRLGLGSLHIVNGRASPEPSEGMKKSAPNWQTTLRRDASSVYPESEIGTVKSRKTVNSDWEDEPLPSHALGDSVRSKPELYRAFSFQPDSEAMFNNSLGISGVTIGGIDSSLSGPQEDKTNTLAQEYIDGLPTSPFAESTPATSPMLPWTANSPPVPVPMAPQETEVVPEVPSTPKRNIETPSSPESTGSVRRYEHKAYSTRSFVDETLESTPEADRSISPESFFSVPEPEEEVDAPFRSAVEIQTSRSRSRSPRKPATMSPLKETANASDANRGPKSDSGYSSNASLGTILPPMEMRHAALADVNAEAERKRGLRFPFHQKMQKSGKPVLVKPTLSTKVPSPKSARIESASALTSTTSFLPTEPSTQNSSASLPTSPLKSKEKRRKLTKMRRKSTVEVAGELVIQRLASVECFNVPPVSNTSKANLAQRSQAIPELDRTYRTKDHTAFNANASVISLATAAQDVRFPSPAPEADDRQGRASSRPRTRTRSFSRPRSWLGWPKRDRSGSRSGSKDRSNANMDHYDFGSVADLLGDNPYDIAMRPKVAMPPSAWNNRPDFFRRRTSPSNITTNNPRPKSTMDDQTASKVSKLRRRSLVERDAREQNQRSFDDRGSVPWMSPHKAHSPTDIPPLPPMPTQEEINHRWSRNGYHTMSSESYENHRQSFDNNQPTSMLYPEPPHDAPPPPPHSPRPVYLEDENQGHYVREPEQLQTHQNNGQTLRVQSRHSSVPSYLDDESGFENAIDDDGPAPPPPSHSPRPMDITPETRSRQSSWTIQANAWKVRRQSAGEALRRSWGKVEQIYRPQQVQDDLSRHPSVPRRKPVPNRWSMVEPEQHPAYRHWTSGEFQQDDHESHGHAYQHTMSPRGSVGPQPGSSYMISNSYHDYHDPSSYDQYQSNADHLDRNQDDYLPNQQQYDLNIGHQPSNAQYNFYADYNDEDSTSYQNSYPRSAYHPDPTLVQSQSRPTSRLSYTSHKSLSEQRDPELFLNPVQPDPSLQPSAPYSGGLELNYRHNPSWGSKFSIVSNSNSNKKRDSWLDMESYGVGHENIPVTNRPVGDEQEMMRDRMVYR